jgi:hypothetical protein
MHRYRIAFLGGLAAGFVVGTRAGRERYEQMKRLARAAADSPAVQQAAGAMQAQAAGLMKSATHKLADELHERVPGVGAAASRIPGRKRRDADGGTADAGQHPFVGASSTQDRNQRHRGG